MLYKDEAAAEYHRAFAHVSEHFLPFLLQAAGLAPGMRVLDVATGTGLAAKAALCAVGPTCSAVATDVSPAMVEQAHNRLGQARNLSVSIEDAQALSFPNESFDAVICSLGLMVFSNPQQSLSEFCRVLRPERRVSVSVLTAPERSYNGRINIIIARYLPSCGPSSSAPASDVIVPPSNAASTRRPSTLAKANESWLHCVGIGEVLHLGSSCFHKTTFADSEPRCAYSV